MARRHRQNRDRKGRFAETGKLAVSATTLCDDDERRRATDPSEPDPFEDWADINTPIDKRDPFGAGPDPFEDWADNSPVDKDDPFGAADAEQATLTILRTKMDNTRSRRKKKRYQRECDEIERRRANDSQPSDPFEDWAGGTPVDKRDPFG